MYTLECRIVRTIRNRDLPELKDDGQQSEEAQVEAEATRCIKKVSRRHSIDDGGIVISSDVSSSRTPRPNINDLEDNHPSQASSEVSRKLLLVGQTVAPRRRSRSLSDKLKSTWNTLVLYMSP